ncbi:MAG: TonB family protein [Acidobacteria bacterium]|nr:TonB family protein [Acidobacteriota bacterium]
MVVSMTATDSKSGRPCLFRKQGFLLLLLLSVVLAAVSPVAAQEAKPNARPEQPPEEKDISEFGSRPIFLNINVFQLEAAANTNPDLTDQVFRMKTSSLQDYDKWTRAFSKTYPGHKVSLLKLERRRAFRTATPTFVPISRQYEGRTMSLEINGAQSPGDGVTPGTSIVSILNMQFGNDQSVKPVTYSITPLEVEHGMTYFYLIKQLRFEAPEYVKFLRPNETTEKFAGKCFYIVLAISVDLDKTYTPARYYDERQSGKLQEEASRKTPPNLPEDLRKAGLSGMVRVRVEIGRDGKVTQANVTYSTVPEANDVAVAAARQWEFPESLFATDQNPITGFISFLIPPK